VRLDHYAGDGVEPRPALPGHGPGRARRLALDDLATELDDRPTTSPRRESRSRTSRNSRCSGSSTVAARNRAASAALHRWPSGVSEFDQARGTPRELDVLCNASAVKRERRILITSELLGIPPAAVQPFDIGFCNRWYGQPDGLETAPKMRPDRRFKPRQRSRTVSL
jgi:hypothetical protein